ncbi:hypothetical protein ABID82_004322 [Methylobacterium sp. PvP062]|uniref:Uncharacterized protein n=1 Tax=Methylobacterium radiotolerans TaxID=31998 RepID=A0ABV2NL05_9HYPH|nr:MULTISPECIES: hypothetical protein [unclassified Methylobacterium]MBP2496084.1 hypothetical protein [Methylobacterium sp. PvP105]MBP2504045.1 hypothetical protein [Methylobacterium sp. PvP109]MCX7333159.1 hypothetical protein [Hyphomicrobiales bacterium]
MAASEHHGIKANHDITARVKGGAMNDKQIYHLSVTTAAMIAVLKTSTIAMMTFVINKLPCEEREAVIPEIARTIGNIPPDYSQESTVGKQFYEDIAVRAPGLARDFASNLRRVLG